MTPVSRRRFLATSTAALLSVLCTLLLPDAVKTLAALLPPKVTIKITRRLHSPWQTVGSRWRVSSTFSYQEVSLTASSRERSPLHTHLFFIRSVIAAIVWQTTGLHLRLTFTVIYVYIHWHAYRGLCVVEEGRGGVWFLPANMHVGEFSLQQTHRNSVCVCVCVRHSVSCQALRRCGSEVHQAGGRALLWAYWMLVQACREGALRLP